ncbi:hypothetical protein B0H12DRAFT_89796 [Mycena haematopus]|nr:hypothetical protein B0H12DRAFT_89796 [Mycena haematopus]
MYHFWASETTFLPDVFLILPRETVDEATGVVTFERDRYHVAFLSNHVAQCAAAMMRQSEDMWQPREVYATQLTAALDHPWVGSAAASLFENILHGALQRAEIDGEAIQNVFGVPAVSAAVMLAGEATDFIVEAGKDEETSARPLYLRPSSTMFAAVNSILITDRAVYLIQCRLGGWHSFFVRTVLQILDRLETKLKFNLHKLQLYYCVVGSASKPVEMILDAATRKLDELKDAVDHARDAKRARGPKRVRTTEREPPAHPELKDVSRRAVGRLRELVARGVVFDPVKNTLSLVE